MAKRAKSCGAKWQGGQRLNWPVWPKGLLIDDEFVIRIFFNFRMFNIEKYNKDFKM